MTSQAGSHDPLHGVTLKKIVTQLVEHYGWQELGERIRINCFTKDPSINSSLKFLRKTPWAREKVEALFLRTNWNKSAAKAGAAKSKAKSKTRSIWPDPNNYPFNKN
ncbi:VF530 family protein [Neiella marina]|uniref:VF530 family protein n=1 Tax=Neiella holothuriorum TaxID=2870530 RepID=A0ABS7EAX3_9GAMM|nr:VF530 family protein [Neiella holothuriorum]MBW8189483.1 VF530 family protein [Neiella holothuriorum]